MAERLVPYEPLGVPKLLAPDLWVVDGPEIAMRYGPGSLPFTTRMTVIRLGAKLVLHSPVALRPGLAEAVSALGEPAWILAPNRLHWVHLREWQDAFPQAATLAAPGLEGPQAEGRFRIDRVLGAAPVGWRGQLELVLVPGGFMTEAVLFHRGSGTAVVTDLVENFEPSRIRSRMLRLLMRAGGVMEPGGGTPRDVILTFLPRRRQARAAAERILAWPAQRIVLAHGRIIEEDARAHLARALGWTGARALHPGGG
ncbi:DUF4336 domain-containing protein [Mangrovicoccus sp. HB161399]|uniref:DUF4336 domain-containing protein n=1 Tax=Mangrovicoccus sp. HB161399 TaxID=2720392 RepID=UPI001C1328C8|nr:DUF4336 domain-containing protein [Mangrovicoccus sp. HB161399]